MRALAILSPRRDDSIWQCRGSQTKKAPKSGCTRPGRDQEYQLTMSHEHNASPDEPSARLARPKPPGLREFSPPAIVCGLFVAALTGATSPCVVLMPGFGPHGSLRAAVLR